MPPKKAKGKEKGKGKKGGKKKKGNAQAQQLMRMLMGAYVKNCQTTNTLLSHPLKEAINKAAEDESVLIKFILDHVPQQSPGDPVIRLEPLITSIRNERYIHIKDLHVWGLEIRWEDAAALSLLLEKRYYPIRVLEMLECVLHPQAITRIASAFNACPTLTTIILDHNEIGDEGCEGLCNGLQENKLITSLSLCYCSLGIPSGTFLGTVVSETAVRELYIDGNDLQCEGTVELLKLCTDRAEEEAFQREEAERIKAEEEMEAALAQQQSRYDYSGTRTKSPASERISSPASKKDDKKKKKKGKKKKKKEAPPPPPVGPLIYKLHIADNGIDNLGSGGQLATLICMRLLRSLIAHSKCLEELDLDDNLIGDTGGKELLEALHEREEAGLPKMKLRTSHRMQSDTLNNLIKLGAGLKKKKKKRGKKKKK